MYGPQNNKKQNHIIRINFICEVEIQEKNKGRQLH